MVTVWFIHTAHISAKFHVWCQRMENVNKCVNFLPNRQWPMQMIAITIPSISLQRSVMLYTNKI